MASPIRRSGRLQLAEIMKRPKVHAAHVDLVDDDEDSVEDRGADGNDNAGSDVSGDDAVIAGDEGGNAEEETDSDDAFDDPPQKTSTDPSPSASRKNAATVKKRKREGITKLKEKYLRIQSRASPNVLQKVVESLNEVQRREVVRIGFGSMLKIKLIELPAKLGYWVVEKFNPRSSSIELADGTKVRVTVDDIRHVLGLPCGRAKSEVGEGEKKILYWTFIVLVGIGEGQSTTRPPLFDGTNYTYWKERMRIYIRSTNFQLWLVIKNGEEVPMKKVGDKLIPKTEDEFDAEDIKKVENYAKAINMLYCAVNPDDYRKISCCSTAKEMWDKLEVTYEGTDQVREAKIDFLTQEYEMFRMKEHENVDDMFDRFSKIVNDLHALKKTYTDRDLVRKILRSLTSEWRSKADAIYESIGTSTVTIDDLRG
ncbi:unnamed protein product [Cuscuta campestris]|uniref:DUF4219 domain-containing protein n=1 Tax=Cuscuta campestris TaxID=132261 RepID=A0A484K258_9ASTE|nr:unnamed protein product [Cuscuta campestris]